MFKDRKINLILIFLLSLIMGWQLFRPGYFSMHDDLQVMRMYQMDKCFLDGQIPCRWSPDMGAGYGQPMFNYYSVFPYYLGELVHLVGFSYVDTIKILFFVCLLGTGVFSYLFLAEIVTSTAAFVGAVSYLIVPYHALDIFVRGALSESYALMLMPLVLLFIFKVFKNRDLTSSLGLSFSIAVLLTTHNISSLISLFVFVPFAFVLLLKNELNLKALWNLIIFGLLGVGLSAFFTLPVALERNLVQTSFLTQDYYDFHAHFATIRQLFTSQYWGFGASRLGPDDGISFAVGIVQTLSLILLPILLLLKKRQKFNRYIIPISFWILAIFSISMTHSRSVFIWDRLPILSFVQFPWRFLGLAAICTSVTVAFVIENIPPKYSKFVAALFVLSLVFLNFGYYRFEKLYPQMTDTQKLSGIELEQQMKSALLDYLPVSSKSIPKNLAPTAPIASAPETNVNYFDHRSNYFSSEFDVYTDNVTVTFPVVYFPGWQIFHNRSSVEYPFMYDNELGLITVKLNRGHHLIQGFFENTTPRNIGNLITFVSFTTILVILAINYEKNKR